MKLTRELDRPPRDEPILLITDHSCVLENILDFCKKKQAVFEVEEVINGVWEVTITPRTVTMP